MIKCLYLLLYVQLRQPQDERAVFVAEQPTSINQRKLAKMADNEEVHYERERSRSRDRGDSDHDEDRAPNGSQDDGYKNDRNGEERRQEEEQPEVHNLYVTNLSFQV